MFRIFIIILQILFLFIITNWFISNAYPVSFFLKDVKITTSTPYLALILVLILILFYIFQKLYFFLVNKYFKLKIDIKYRNYEKGYFAFTKGMIALANNDLKKAHREANIASRFLKDKTLNLLLLSETLKIEKKYDELNQVYEKMLLNKNTEDLGLKGLMKQNLYAQDYHHAFVYGEKLFQKNPGINDLYDSLLNIIGRTKNWYKLIDITDKAFNLRLIDKKKYSVNKSIAFYEISKIKKDSEQKEAIVLIEKALNLREFFPPYVIYYIKLLIESGKFSKAKKYLSKAWRKNPFYNYKHEIKLLAEKMKISHVDLVNYIVSSSQTLYESRLLLSSSLIDSQKWEDAKKCLSPLLDHKPSYEVCILMSKIEEGETNDPQRINAWVARANFGELNKVWICRITNNSQNNWTSVSDLGHFNSLEYKKVNQINNLGLSNIETNLIEYINN